MAGKVVVRLPNGGTVTFLAGSDGPATNTHPRWISSDSETNGIFLSHWSALLRDLSPFMLMPSEYQLAIAFANAAGGEVISLSPFTLTPSEYQLAVAKDVDLFAGMPPGISCRLARVPGRIY